MTARAANQRSYRKRKKDKGECIYGGCHEKCAPSNLNYCASHRETANSATMRGHYRSMTRRKLLELRDKYLRLVALIEEIIA